MSLIYLHMGERERSQAVIFRQSGSKAVLCMGIVSTRLMFSRRGDRVEPRRTGIPVHFVEIAKQCMAKRNFVKTDFRESVTYHDSIYSGQFLFEAWLPLYGVSF